MASHLGYPPKPRPGDRVAVVSPSAGAPGRFPRPFELGLTRLREDFGLVPVEYPATRTMGAAPADRAADLHAAFSDPGITAVITSIGGEDEIRVLRHLDAGLLRDNPKPFFGYSDNTCLLAYLWKLGIVCYHGGCVMVQYGRPGAMHPDTEASLRAALFGTEEFRLTPATAYTDVERDWDDPASFGSEPEMTPGHGWIWHNQAGRVVEGIGWGGNVEVLSWLLMAGRAIPEPQECQGGVLFLETSEELPPATEVYRILRAMGERGLLARFPAVLFGRPKAWSLEHQTTPEQRAAYASDQHDAVLRALAEYAPDAMAVLDVDFGHTDPQLVLPCGGMIRVDGMAKRIAVRY
jgi:muramoyltetrapeptide carboxypeptidase LdcA involved in peptidoglycan recycling